MKTHYVIDVFKLFGPYIGLWRLCWVSGVIILIDWQKRNFFIVDFQIVPKFSPWKLFLLLPPWMIPFSEGCTRSCNNVCDLSSVFNATLTELMWFMWVAVEVVWSLLRTSSLVVFLSLSVEYQHGPQSRGEGKKKKMFWTYLEGFINKKISCLFYKYI